MIRLILTFLFPILAFSVPFEHFRAPSDPFISGDGFRAHCDYAFDETGLSFDPASVYPCSKIFVKADMMEDFFSRMHPQLPSYILVTHNSDDPSPGRFASYLDDPKILAWFAQNVDCGPHPKLYPIPMGIANRHWGHGNPDWLQKAINAHTPKMHLAYFNFTIQNNYAERWKVFQTLAYAPYMYRPIKKRFDGYLADVAASQFNLSPKGNALDTHRIWESIYLGTYPIVRTSTLDPLYKNLPIVIIDSWNDVTEDFLLAKYEELNQKTFNLETSTMGYWKNLIDSVKIQALKAAKEASCAESEMPAGS